MAMTESEIRGHILAAYKQTPGRPYGDIRSYVATRKPPPGQLNGAEESLFRQIMWEFALEGIVSPRGAEVGQLLSEARLTEYGRKCVEQEQVLPHDVDGYLEHLKTRMGETHDELILQYAREALECFHRNNLRAAVVMLGVAAERGLDLLKEAYIQQFDQAERPKARQSLNERHLRKRFDCLWKRIEDTGGPEELQDKLEGDFWGAFQLVRRSRNDAGHFTTVETDKLTALACLASFPGFINTLFRLVAWFAEATTPKES